jgi:hypothetical protein
LEWNLPVLEDYGDKDQLDLQHKAITALYTALAEPEKHEDWCDSVTKMLTSLPPKPAPCNCKRTEPEQNDTALAEPEQEPVAWIYRGNLHPFDPSDWATETVTPLYTHPVDDTALLRQAYLLCDEINKMPHVRGSINGMAVQLQYALRERLGEKA